MDTQLSLCSLQVSGQKEVCAECVCAASFSAATANRGPAGCKDPGQWHTGRPAPGKKSWMGAYKDKLY